MSQERKVIFERNDPVVKKRLLEEWGRDRSSEEKAKAWEQMEKHPVMRLEDMGTIEGCEVRGLWLMHHPIVFAHYKADFANLMQDSDGLYTESLSRSDLTYEQHEKFLKIFKALAQKYKLLDGKRALTPKDEERLLVALKHENPLAHFFHAIEGLAREKGIAIASADPLGDGNETAAVHKFMDEMVKGGKRWGVITGMGIASGFLASLGIRYLVSSEVDRRQFLKYSGGMATGAAVAGISGLSWGADVRMKDGTQERAGEGPLSNFLYNWEDYRDAVGSAGLIQFCKILSDSAKERGDTRKPKVLLVYGQAHQGPINHYNDHPKRRSMTLRSYMRTFGEVRRPSLMMHRPIRQGKGYFFSHEHQGLDQSP